MIDRYYIENTKSKYTDLHKRLLKRGYRLESYGDITPDIGEATYIKPGVMLKAKYQWVKNPAGRGYISGKMISLEDMTSCYSMIDGKATGYR